jgi:A/G-specific adenine glycosylase
MLPVKAKKLQKKERWFYYLIIETENGIYIHQRKEKDIWQNLYEFILLETKKEMKNEEMIHSDFIKNIFGKEKFTIEKISAPYKQQLTHQTIHVHFVHINIAKQVLLKDYMLIKKKDINKYPFPKSITAYLSQSAIFR